MTSLTSFWCFYCQLWTYFTPFSSTFIVDFEQVNVSWVTNSCVSKRSFPTSIVNRLAGLEHKRLNRHRRLVIFEYSDNYQYDYKSILGQNTQYNWKSKGRKEEEKIYLAFQEETCIDDAPSGRKGKGEVCVKSDNDTMDYSSCTIMASPTCV